MSNTENINLWLALSFAPQIGPAQFARIRAHFSSLEAVFSASEAALLAANVPAVAIPAIRHPDEAKIQAHLAWATQANHFILTLEDVRYPELLKQIHAPPPILFAKGHLPTLHRLQIAMVGSRHPTHAGKENAFYFARALTQQGVVVTSGLALGIDAASHEGGVSVAGAGVAVMGTGLDVIYPAKHQALAAAMLNNNGVWLSEFPLGTATKPENFPRRNRLISGLSRGVFVVEAALQSGSLITARYALEQGREVYAMPGSIHNPLAKGCHYLLKQGAKLVENVTDLLEEIQIKSNHTSCEAKAPGLPPTPPVLDADLSSLLECMAFVPTSFDSMVARSGFSADKVAALLARLEFEGVVIREGARYIPRETSN